MLLVLLGIDKSSNFIHPCWIDRSICSAPAMADLGSMRISRTLLQWLRCNAMDGWMDNGKQTQSRMTSGYQDTSTMSLQKLRTIKTTKDCRHRPGRVKGEGANFVRILSPYQETSYFSFIWQSCINFFFVTVSRIEGLKCSYVQTFSCHCFFFVFK